jgi:type IV pilus assembly protein PilY1
MSKSTPMTLRRRLTLVAAAATFVAAITSAVSVSFAAPAPLAISQVPLTISIPPHPQVLWAVPNSESTDGTLSGAIMTGSGALAANLSVLQSSSSPVNYTIPAGFTPPINPGAAGVAPYTVTTAGVQYDNSSSRLNNAKAGISAVINTYMAEVDFALETFSAGAGGPDTTWLYLMSPPGGFVFTSLPGASEYAANPCYQYNPAALDPVSTNCKALDTFYLAQNISAQKYVLLSASSDDPSVNDVLYAGGLAPLCVVYGGPNPASPFPPNRTLAQYETGSISVGYSSKVPAAAGCALATGPTNAGFVPYSTQVMYLQRGFGYIGGASPTTGTVLVPMTTSGATPTPISVSNAIGKFTQYLAPETNKSSTPEIKAVAIQSPIAGLLKGALNYYTGVNKPGTSNGCPNALQYVVLVTDGLPTQDLANHNWPPLGSASAAGYGVTATYNANGSLNVTNDQALIDTISQITALANVGIKTYVIGLGAGVDPAVNPAAAAALTAMAVAGNTTAYFPATTEVALTVDMQVILAKVLAETQSVATGAVNSTGLQTGSVLYQGQFTTSDSFQDWTGNLYAFPLVFNAQGQVPTLPIDATWSAQTQLDAQAWDVGRMIVTWDPVSNDGIPFQWRAGNAANGIGAGSPLGAALTTFVPDPNGQDVLQFLRGSNAQEVRNGGQFRNRTHKLGDIVYSAPLYIQAPVGLSQTASYLAFVQANKNRQAMMYVGANDGMLHAFNATTGNEQWAYVPAGVFNNLIKLVNPYYNEQHQFYVNASPQAYDVQFGVGGPWHTLLIGGVGAGGNDIYGIDVTNPTSAANENQLATQVLWDYTDVDMGYSYSNPAAQQVAAGWLVFFGNGYDSPQGKPFLYAINPQTGALVRKIDLCGAVPGICNLGVTNGLSSVSVVNSGGQLSGIANLVYAGDLQGNLWRIDVSNMAPGSWQVSVMFQATDSSAGLPQPITVTPAVSLNPKYPSLLGTMVYFGTGQLLTVADLTNNQTQTVYGIYDPPNPYPTPINRTALVAQTLSMGPLASTGQATRTITGNAVTLPGNKGWDVDLNLPTSGTLSAERDVTDPQLIAGGVLLTSYQPSTSQCTLGGGAYLLDFNFATGGTFTTAQFTTPTGTTIGTAATVGLSMGAWYAPAPAVVNAGGSYVAIVTTGNGGAVCGKAGCPQGQGVIGLTQHRKAWWEIL